MAIIARSEGWFPLIFGLAFKAERAPNDSVTLEIRDASKAIDLVSKVSKREDMIESKMPKPDQVSTIS